MHEYKLTKYSLYAAASIGLTFENIFEVLDRLAKNREIPADVKDFIKEHTQSYGKAKLVLKNNQYFVEAVDLLTIDKLKNL